MALAEQDSGSRTARNYSSRSPLRMISAPLAMLSFWSAIVLPAIYVPVALVGIGSSIGLTAFLGLFGLHILTLIGGQFHRSNECESSQ